MRSAELLDLNDQEHAEFLYELLTTCKDDFLDDYEQDILKVINDYAKSLHGESVAFLCSVNGEKAGIIGVTPNARQVGELLAAMMPKYRDGLGRNAYFFLDGFIEFCFHTLEYRKLRALNPIDNQKPEKLLRRYGFRKAGLHPEETMKNGKPVLMVELYMTKNLYEAKKRNEQKPKTA